MPLPWLTQLRRYLPPLSPVTTAASDQPLLAAGDLQPLRARASQPHPSLIRFEHNVAQPRIGDRLSRFRGRGFEFEENRVYQPGDEQRLINWRLYARRGELYSKVFVEERRPEVFVLVDRRAAMRFGTRVRLKATLAAQLAAITLFQARHRMIAAGGVVLEDRARWFSPAQGAAGLDALLEAISAPCPPQSFDREQESLPEVLAQLAMRLDDGCFILLLSDFADLDVDHNTAILQRLGEKHTVQAIRIHDAVEARLPPIQPLLIDDPGFEPLVVDGREANHDGRYDAAVARQQQLLDDCFSQCRIAAYHCEASVDWGDCLQQAARGSAGHG
ncbi:DUF58 domain-containing protein [Thiohalophilus thiocyanatoxydans]|uniref:Uncharacterized protein DUF58 n=1 Tax=Thiohalophilus thiocyanatoxydans TaxID=381308 RepID=A0A4R8ITR9_9GAMM|nr:DUF58 domain-containing protein [Thiohalophilus thiocyanatoxydans]TDY02820.1 uncharacterized protein DUF58 [Thiohalophilus thiocyanatoxydans]